MKKIIVIINLLIVTLILINTPVMATFEINTKEIGSEIVLDNNQGTLSKKIVEISEKEAIIEINLVNTAKDEDSSTEIIFVLDNSSSMSTQLKPNKNRKEVIMDAAITLTNKIFNEIKNVKVGAIKFSTKSNVAVIQELTDNKTQIVNSLTNFSKQGTEGNTNIEAGMITAQNKFTPSVENKIIILLTDGIPTHDYMGNTNQNVVISNTKKSLRTEGIYTISVLAGITSDVEKVFGTSQNPTADKFYNIEDKDITETIQENIYVNIIENIKRVMRQIEIKDYFPQEIIDNFIIEYLEDPNIGEVTPLDKENRNFTWKIEELEQNEEATFRYKVIFREENNQDMINKTLETNEKVEIKYINKNNEVIIKEITDNPSIEIKEKKEDYVININEDKENTINEDNADSIKNEENNNSSNTIIEKNNNTNTTKTISNTTAPGKLPSAGNTNILIIIMILIITGTISYIKSKK